MDLIELPHNILADLDQSRFKLREGEIEQWQQENQHR
jgi:hypothetical protein